MFMTPTEIWNGVNILEHKTETTRKERKKYSTSATQKIFLCMFSMVEISNATTKNKNCKTFFKLPEK